MKRQNIKRTALLAALSVSIIIFGAIVFTPHENDDTFVEIKPISTPEVVHMELPIPLSSSVATLRPIPMSETIESPAPSPPAERYHLRRIRRRRINAQENSRLAYDLCVAR